MSDTEFSRLDDAIGRFEKLFKLLWWLAAAIVAVTAWIIKIQGQVDQVPGIASSIHRIDRSLQAIAGKAGVTIENPRD